MSLFCFKIISHQALIYLSELLHLYTPSRQLRSSSDTRVFRMPSFRTKSCSQRFFSYQDPVMWNQLPVSVRHSTSVSSFKSSLKSSLKTILLSKTFLRSYCPDMRLCSMLLCDEGLHITALQVRLVLLSLPTDRKSRKHAYYIYRDRLTRCMTWPCDVIGITVRPDD